MNDLKRQIIALHHNESGATATEYIILLILVACFVIAVVKLFGQTVSSKFGEGQTAVADMVTM